MLSTALSPVIGHRCARAFAPENTLAGLTRAAALRYGWLNGAAHGGTGHWVEVDVRLTADDVPVLLHDATLERTTNGRGALADMPWATVRQFDAGRYFDTAFAGEPIPTLEAFLIAALKYGIGVNLELKADTGDPSRVAEVALAVAQPLWQPGGPGAGKPPPLISSFASTALDAVARLAPEWPRGLLLDRIGLNWLTTARRVGAAAIIVNHRHLVSEAVVATFRADDRAVLSYTVNDTARATHLRHWGVAAVITDRPDTEMAMAAKIRPAENNFLYGSMVTSCGGHDHNTWHTTTGPAVSVAGSMIGRVP